MSMFGGGGFGGDAGNQFAGGFMPSQAPDNGFGGGGGGSGGRSRNNTAMTLRTLTIGQLVKGAANTDDEVIKVDGVELNNVTVLGKIVSVRDSNMNLTFTIIDGTGQMDVDHWISDDSEYTAANKKAEWQPGVYIKAFGHMRRANNKVHLQAFNIRTISDFNEMTYHHLRCIFEHLHLTKGGAGAQAMGGAAAGMGMAPPAAAAGGWGAGPAQGGGATAYAGAAGGVGDACSSAVMALISACNSDLGVHVHDIYNQLNGQFGKAAIDAALQSLTSEAHLYTTTDDDHFKAA